jgi:serine phosphatase RsbU (regulator of sigma subunit)
VLSVPPDTTKPQFVAEVDGVNEESLWPETKQTLTAFANSLADHFERRRAARTLALSERREEELQLAGLIQASLVQFPSQIPNATLAWQYLPAGKLGGDWISAYYDAPSKRLRFFAADATGHGVVPAMVTALVAGAARHFSLSPLTSSNFTSDKETESLKRFAAHLNGIVLEAGGGKIGLSLVMGSLACESGVLTLLQFGHPFPLLFDARSADSGGVSVLKPQGNFGLGNAHFPHPKAQHIQLQSGQGLFLYTDGIVENFQCRLTTRRIRKILASSVNCGDAVDAVVREYASESGSNGVPGDEGHDDVALLALRWVG